MAWMEDHDILMHIFGGLGIEFSADTSCIFFFYHEGRRVHVRPDGSGVVRNMFTTCRIQYRGNERRDRCEGDPNSSPIVNSGALARADQVLLSKETLHHAATSSFVWIWSFQNVADLLKTMSQILHEGALGAFPGVEGRTDKRGYLKCMLQNLDML